MLSEELCKSVKLGRLSTNVRREQFKNQAVNSGYILLSEGFLSIYMKKTPSGNNYVVVRQDGFVVGYHTTKKGVPV